MPVLMEITPKLKSCGHYGSVKSTGVEGFEVLKQFKPELEKLTGEQASYYIDKECETYLIETKHEDWIGEEKPKLDDWFKQNFPDEVSKHVLKQQVIDYWEETRGQVMIKADQLTSMVVDLELWQEAWNYGYEVLRPVKLKMKPFEEKTDEVINSLTNILNITEEKLFSLNHVAESLKGINFNQKCNVHLGGGFLTRVNRLKLVEDACTDGLQEDLNKGWRIISVCVQADQRRPDYVLGRYDEGYDHDETQAVR